MPETLKIYRAQKTIKALWSWSRWLW